MSDGRTPRLLRLLGDVRGHEAAKTAELAVFFFLVTFSFYIIKPVKESLLIGITPAWWPYADLFSAIFIGFIVALNARLLHRLPRRLFLVATQVIFIGCLVGFWSIFDIFNRSLIYTPTIDSSGILFGLSFQMAVLRTWPLGLFLFCFWADAFIALSITQFWMAVNDAFDDPHQAKRLVSVFVTGGLAGGLAGSLVATLTVRFRLLTTEGLLLVCPIALAAAAVLVERIYEGAPTSRERDRPGASGGGGYWDSLRTVLREPYLRGLAGVLSASVIVGSLVNFQFKVVVKSVLEDKGDRTSFLGAFFFAILVVSALFHLAATGRILRRFRIGTALLVAPGFLLGATWAAFALPAAALLAWASLIRGGDKVLDTTLTQSVRELLIMPVSPEIKYKAKLFIDMFVNKSATAVGAALFWALYRLLDFAMKPPEAQVRELGIVVTAFVLLWIVLGSLLWARYPEVLKQRIPSIWTRGEKIVEGKIDPDLVRRVIDTVQSREQSPGLFWMNLYDLLRRHEHELTDELKGLLGLRPDDIRAGAVGHLFGEVGGVGLPAFSEAKDVWAEISEVFKLPDYFAVMKDRLEAISLSPVVAERQEAAKLCGLMMPRPEVLATLGRLLGDPSPEVVYYALSSAAVHRAADHVPLILKALGEPATRAEAQSALAAYGPLIELKLIEVLRGGGETPEVRKAVPEVLARLGTASAATALLGEMERPNGELEEELVEALHRLRTARPDLRLDRKAVRSALLAFVRRAAETVLEADGRAEALSELRFRRIFDVLALRYPPGDIEKAYQNLKQGSPRSIGHALELLESLLDRETKALVLPLIEDLAPAERAERLKRAFRGHRRRPRLAERLKYPGSFFRMRKR